MQGELYSALKNEKEEEAGSDSSTSFSGEMHFYELVEDTKDGIWLVQVDIILLISTFYLIYFRFCFFLIIFWDLNVFK